MAKTGSKTKREKRKQNKRKNREKTWRKIVNMDKNASEGWWS